MESHFKFILCSRCEAQTASAYSPASVVCVRQITGISRGTIHFKRSGMFGAVPESLENNIFIYSPAIQASFGFASACQFNCAEWRELDAQRNCTEQVYEYAVSRELLFQDDGDNTSNSGDDDHEFDNDTYGGYDDADISADF